jgi:hypothetical protein
MLIQSYQPWLFMSLIVSFQRPRGHYRSGSDTTRLSIVFLSRQVIWAEGAARHLSLRLLRLLPLSFPSVVPRFLHRSLLRLVLRQAHALLLSLVAQALRNSLYTTALALSLATTTFSLV